MRNGKKNIIAALVALSVVGCASQPESIDAQHVSDRHYEHMNCEQLVNEAHDINGQAAHLFNKLNDEANMDAAQFWTGMLVFWPALFFLEGGDGPEAATYSRLKGEFTAVERQARKKNCPGVPGAHFSMFDTPQINRG